MTHGPTQLSQQKPGIKRGLSGRRISGGCFCNGMTLVRYTGEPERFFDCCINRNTASLGQKGQKQDEMREGS